MAEASPIKDFLSSFMLGELFKGMRLTGRHFLAKKVTVFRVGALVVNVAVLLWLLWSKRLFGLRGGAAALEAAARLESEQILRSFEPEPDGPEARFDTPVHST